MPAKNLSLRLDAQLHERLKVVSEARNSSMVDLVREALLDYLPRVAAVEADSLGEQLPRLQGIAAEPGYIEKSMKAAARAESACADEMELGLVAEDRRPKDAPITKGVVESLG
jgi:hypothetical protein